ncbi:MAG TPA: hypothetical protein VHT97_09680 [Acidimicrobiales bacterium]|jgi:hypothetical protein|nr:hypothetical protein [Acidimicrobiales bacterium]
MTSTKPAVVALVACALSDLAAVPLLLGRTDVPAVVGILVGVLGILTVVAAVGVARNARWAGRLAVATRLIDLSIAAPGLAVSGHAPALAAWVTVALSIAALVLTLRRTSTTSLALSGSASPVGESSAGGTR